MLCQIFMHYSIFLLVIFKCYIIYFCFFKLVFIYIYIYMFIHMYIALLSMCPFVQLTVSAVIQYFFPYVLISILSSLILWISETLVSKCTFIMILYLSFLFSYFKILLIFLTLFGLWIGSFQLYSLLACHLVWYSFSDYPSDYNMNPWFNKLDY